MFEPVLTRCINGGTQDIYRFDNGYGASVVNHSFSYGTELAVIQFHGKDIEFSLVYSTPITDDVIGNLTDDEVEEVLQQIKDL